MASIKQGDQTITDYFTKLCVIWDELEVTGLTQCAHVIQSVCDALTSVMERK